LPENSASSLDLAAQGQANSGFSLLR